MFMGLRSPGMAGVRFMQSHNLTGTSHTPDKNTEFKVVTEQTVSHSLWNLGFHVEDTRD